MASEYLKWKYRDVKPDEPVVLTRKQKLLNWWHYHKWMLCVAVVLLLIALDLGKSFLESRRNLPDYQMACVVSVPLDEKTISALEARLSGLGQDCNGDGRVIFRLNTYADYSGLAGDDATVYASASRTRLMADLEACESYFFLLSDSETFHSNYGILAREDGTLADSTVAAFSVPLTQLPLFSESDSAAFSGLSLARRGFWQQRVCANREQCDALWRKLMSIRNKQ